MRGLARRLGLAAAGAACALLAAETGYRALEPATDGGGDGRVRVRESSDPEIRYTLEPDVDQVIGGVRRRTNSRGLYDEELDLAKPEGELRIAVLGDSFSAAAGVTLEDTWHSHLEALLGERLGSPVQCVNFAVGGYNLIDYAALAERHVAAYDPDFVVVGLCFNDQYQLSDPRAGRFEAVPRPATVLGSRVLGALLERGAPDPAEAELAADGGGATPTAPANHVRKSMRRINKACRENGWGLLFVHLTFESDQFLPAERATSLFRGFATQLRAPFLDGMEAFPPRSGTRFYLTETDRHPNAEAHALFAPPIADRILELMGE